MKIVIFAVPFSPNLGDGIIYECLKYAIERAFPGHSVDCCDISGRTGYINSQSNQEVRSRKFLAAIPPFIRPIFPLIRFAILSRKKLKSHYNKNAKSACLAIIGGGQLFSDVALNFPIKISLLSNVLQNYDYPKIVYGVGVPKNISSTGRQLFKNSLSRIAPKLIATRDEESLSRINAIHDGCHKAIVFDPAVITSLIYPPVNNSTKQRKNIGISVIAEAAVKLGRKSGPTGTHTIEFYAAVGKILLSLGYEVTYISNGSFDDHAFLQEIQAKNKDIANSQCVKFIDQPYTPKDLAETISVLDGLVADRLHANIIAYSYGIPSVGFSRDEKAPAFFDAVNRSKFCLDEKSSPGHVVETLRLAITEGLPRDEVIKAQNTTLLQIEKNLTFAMNEHERPWQ